MKLVPNLCYLTMYFTRQPQTTHPDGGADLSNCKTLDLSTLQPHTHTHAQRLQKGLPLTLPSNTQIEKEMGLLKVRRSIFEELH